MIITKSDLKDIETTVGYGCEAGVLSGPDHGSLKIRVWSRMPNGTHHACEHVFNKEEQLNRAWKSTLDQFAYWAKNQFDKAHMKATN